MELSALKDKIPEKVYAAIEDEVHTLRPAQEKAIDAGLLEGKNLLVCTPTASGKTLVAELAATGMILEQGRKAVYIVPLKALAIEKNKDFKRRYGTFMKIALSIGDLDSADPYLADRDLIICTAEKLDSLIRHHSPWLKQIGVMVVDEIHLLNDPGRGPTLEMLITMLRSVCPGIQIIGLSATIGNPEELASWLDAVLVEDRWRPVQLDKGVYLDGTLSFP
ncbi:MAG: DEAD/DEAH box helicase [DPANN group archaeon]|nr:DEAD/DEAH box helicase [DPANN group archaeon]